MTSTQVIYKYSPQVNQPPINSQVIKQGSMVNERNTSQVVTTTTQVKQ